MPSVSPSQMTLSFEPTVVDRFPTLRHFIAHRATQTAKSMKSQAADMDMAPSTLTRKLNPSEGDTQRLNCDDLEDWLKSTGETPAIVEYLVAKYMDSPEARRARLLDKLEGMVPELMASLASLKEPA